MCGHNIKTKVRPNHTAAPNVLDLLDYVSIHISLYIPRKNFFRIPFNSFFLHTEQFSILPQNEQKLSNER